MDTDTQTNKHTAPSKDFTFAVIGCVYSVYNEIGFGYQEKHYYRGIKANLLEKRFIVSEQLAHTLTVKDNIIGKYFLDFLVSSGEDKIILEIKVADQVYHKHIKQVLGYLTAHSLKLGIIAVISKNGVIIKRVIN